MMGKTFFTFLLIQKDKFKKFNKCIPTEYTVYESLKHTVSKQAIRQIQNR